MRKILAFLFTASLLVHIFISLIQKYPGYMDADYYYMGGLRLADGYGFTDPIIWNFLDKPIGIPHPSHQYWMPLASIVSAVGVRLSYIPGLKQISPDFINRIPFILIASLVPVFTALIGYRLSNNSRAAFLSGMLALFSGFYLPFMGTYDTFGISMVIGGCVFLIMRSQLKINRKILLLGALSGIMNLARAEGGLWLLIAFFYVTFEHHFIKNPEQKFGTPSSPSGLVYVKKVLALTLGYFVITGGWLWQTFLASGSIQSVVGLRTLWLTSYDELFTFTPEKLSLSTLLANGFMELFKVRLWALGQNIQTVFAVQGEIFLIPLVIAGLWSKRKSMQVWFVILSWIVLLGSLSILFPFSSARGGYFHASAIFQPVIWALVPVGLVSILKIGERRRRWDVNDGYKFFSIGLIVFAVLMSAYVVKQRVIGNDAHRPTWRNPYEVYQDIERELNYQGIVDTDTVMVNNPPGYFVVTNRSAIVIPSSGFPDLLAAAKEFNIRYLILEKNHPTYLNDLYSKPDQVQELLYLKTVGDVELFEFSLQ